MPKKKLQGVVVSDKMQKALIVEVKRMVFHRKYKKRYFISKRYKAHDEKNEYKRGEQVIIEESFPSSKEKKWRVVRKIK
jgi:small subunit ribosomal protein S17